MWEGQVLEACHIRGGKIKTEIFSKDWDWWTPQIYWLLQGKLFGLKTWAPLSLPQRKISFFSKTFLTNTNQNTQNISYDHCNMCLSTQLELSKVFKSKGLVFAQFWPDFKNSTSGWSKTLKRFGEKYSRQIFVKNVALVGKKPVGHVRPTWNFTHK